jgi:hypothetical protein
MFAFEFKKKKENKFIFKRINIKFFFLKKKNGEEERKCKHFK